LDDLPAAFALTNGRRAGFMVCFYKP